MLVRARESLKAPLPALGTLRARPHVLLYSLGSALRPWVLLAIVLTVALFGFPPLRDAILDRTYPQENLLERMSSIFHSGGGRDAQRLAAARWMDRVFWATSLGSVLIAFWVDLPRGVGRAERRSRQKQAIADRIAPKNATASRAHYRTALRLAIEPERIAQLEQRLRAVGPIAPSGKDPGLLAGRYRRVEQIARGANGIVHRGVDETLDRPVALKQLAATVAGEQERARFRQEARALAQLRHPHIVQVYDLFEHEGSMWIAMELVEGGDLFSHIRSQGRIPVHEALQLARDIASGMDFAHGNDIIHRDLKAMNVLLTAEGSPKIADFGTAKLSSSTLQTVGGSIMGSPLSMSPEQVRGEEADARSDIYALGVLIYQMLLGRPPFEGEMMAVMRMHLESAPPILDQQPDAPQLPPSISTLVQEMLAKDPSQRPASMKELVHELEDLREELTVS